MLLPGETGNSEIVQNTKNIIWSQQKHPLLSKWLTVCTIQDLGRNSILQYVTLMVDV